tara:strand:- start:39 stop:476 length:438 start_codon:yes stop_codon:yes gene_type:complete
VTFKSFSQIDTLRSPVVILTEKQAKQVIKDLIQYDNLKLITKKLEDRISLFQQKEFTLLQRIKLKDSIISAKNTYINTQESIINKKKPLRFNGYLGVQSFQATLIDPILFGEIFVEIKKFEVGARMFIQPNNPSGYGFVVRYKIF